MSTERRDELFDSAMAKHVATSLKIAFSGALQLKSRMTRVLWRRHHIFGVWPGWWRGCKSIAVLTGSAACTFRAEATLPLSAERRQRLGRPHIILLRFRFQTGFNAETDGVYVSNLSAAAPSKHFTRLSHGPRISLTRHLGPRCLI